MTKWEVAKYLLSAKRDIDSLLFIKENLEKIPMTIRMDYVNRMKDHFYINCCVVVDEYLKQKNIKSKEKTLWKDSYIKIQQVYYERDKNSAHIDSDYQMKNFNSFGQLINEMKSQLKEIHQICKDILPLRFEINYFPHDKVLFRLINKVDQKKEEEINKSKYVDHKEGFAIGELSKPRNVVYDIKELRGLSEEKKKELAVLVEAGLNFFEAQQNLQDFYILINAIHDLNYWTFEVENRVNAYLELRKSGILDAFDRPKKIKVITMEFKNWVYNTANYIWGYGLWKK